MSYYNTCPDCGANLDPGERCDCKRYDVYNLLLKFCRMEGLQLIEAELSNENAIATFREDCVVLNTAYKRKGSKGVDDFCRLIHDAVCGKEKAPDMRETYQGQATQGLISSKISISQGRGKCQV